MNAPGRLRFHLPSGRNPLGGPEGRASWLASIPRWVSLPLGMGLSVCILAQVMLMLPPEGTIFLAVIGAGVTIWVLFPLVSIYAIVVLAPFEMRYRMGGLNGVRALDAVIFTLVVVVTGSLVSRSPRISRLSSPLVQYFLGIWAFIAIWNGLTFLMGEANQLILGGAVKNSWYLYRESWRILLPFPLLAYCLPDRRSARQVVDVLLAVTTGVALYAWYISIQTQGPAMAPFNTKNALAGFMILVIPFAITRFLFEERLKVRLFYVVLLALLARVLWLTGSRGGFVAFAVSLLPLVLRVPWKRLAAAGAVGVLVLGLFAVTRGNIMEKPMVKRFLTLTDPTEQKNFQWRLEQWRLLKERVEEHPWMGTGSDEDPELEKMGRLKTAHNGYLGLTLRAGIPAAAVWIVLLGTLGVMCTRFVRKAKSTEDLSFWTGMSCALLALVIHNFVETTILQPQIQLAFWTLLAAALVMAIESPRRPATTSGAYPSGGSE